MPKANLKRETKLGHAICACDRSLRNPIRTRHWREVPGGFMEADSQENINTWWDVFTEIATECSDWKRINRRRSR